MRAGTDREGEIPLHGRSSVLARIERALDEVERGEGQVVVISGPSGMGKSAVLDTAVQRAKDRGFRVAEGRTVPRDTPVPYDLMRELLRSSASGAESSASTPGPSGLPQWLIAGDQASVVSGFPSVAILPEEETPVEKRILRLFEFERSLVSLGRRLLHAQLERDMLAAPQAPPVLLAIDDLQHADPDSLEFLQSVARRIRDHRVLLLATVDSEMEVAGPKGRLLQAVTHGSATALVALPSLTLEETEELIRDLRPDSPPSPEYVQAMHQRSKGIPSRIEQLTRRYKNSVPAEEKPAEETRGAERLGGLGGTVPEDTLRTLTYAAVLGRQFDLAVLARTQRRRPAEALELLLAPLVENGTLRLRGKQRYEFRDPATRQELYTTLPEAQRRLVHRNIARALEITATFAGPELFETAYHYHLSGESVPSVDYNRRAADACAREYAYEEAQVYLDRALDSLRQLPTSRPESERMVRIALGHVLSRIGKVAEAAQVLEPLRDPARTGPLYPTPLEELFVPEVRPDLWSHAEAARAAAERSLRAFETKGDLRWLAVTHRALGVAAWSLADPVAAEEHHRAAAELARQAGDAQLEGQSLLDRAHLVRLLDPNGLVISRRLLTEAIARFTESGDADWLSRAYLDRSAVLRSMGRLPDALSDLNAAGERAAQSGSQVLETWVILRTARVLVEEGRTGRARKALERLKQLAGEAPRREVEQQMAFITGALQEREGRLDRARALYERSLALAIEAEASEEVLECHRRLAELERKAGRLEEARSHQTEVERLAATAQWIGQGSGAR